MVKNRLMSIASIITVMGCTLILAISYFLITNVNQLLAGVERSMSIVAFVDIGTEEADIAVLEQQLLSLPYVVSMSFTSSAEAFENVATDMGIDEELLLGFGEETFPASFAIEVDNIENQLMVVEEIEALDHIRGVRHDQEAMEIFIDFSQAVTIFGVITIVFLAGISTVIIINTIKISLQIRKNEISIMKYVGATDWFIRWPFIIEGMFIGIIGAIFPILVSFFLYQQAYLMFQSIEILDFIRYRNVVEIFAFLAPLCLMGGIFLGVIGSVSSIRKYLKA